MIVPRWIVPLLVIAATAGGISGARLVTAPSLTRTFDASPIPRVAQVRFSVRGLRCVDTARRFATQLEGAPGVRECVAYAARHEAVVRFDPDRASAQTIRAAIESPSIDATTGIIEFHPFDVLTLDGKPPVDGPSLP